MTYSYDYRRASNSISSGSEKGLIDHALREAFKRGGFNAMMMQAYQIEAGVKPFEKIREPRRWLYDLLNFLSDELPLSDREKFSLHNYRQDIR